jgi:hypothetical protein
MDDEEVILNITFKFKIKAMSESYYGRLEQIEQHPNCYDFALLGLVVVYFGILIYVSIFN